MTSVAEISKKDSQMFNVVTAMTMIQNQRTSNREWHCYLLILNLMLAMTRQMYQMHGENLLTWWRLNRNRFPVLANFVKTVLCVRATSVPCERLSSSSGYIVSKTHAALLPENVTTLVCLRDWLKAW